MPTFSIGDADFLLDDRPHRILSGALHYFRVHPDQWADRIRKARLMGLNAVETYVAWNAHEPRQGEWDASGWNDLGRFLDLVADEGLHAIVRPGPYICAEWHNGGLPVWVTSKHDGRLRSSDPAFLADVSGYLRRVYDIIAPRQIHRDGSVILVQIENEYGAYAADAVYLQELVRVTRDAGIAVPLTTVDQPVPQMLVDGSLPSLHRTGSFGSHAKERLAVLREYQPTGPLMCAEFWDGWFDWWGGHHHTTDPHAAATELDALLAAGASVNFYMFHGGTNFGLTNGANDKGRYLPLVTSYDYDAPLDEAGEPTEKFWAFRDVIAKYEAVPTEMPGRARPKPSFEVALQAAGDWLWSAREEGSTHTAPPTFEELGFLGALVLYETELADNSFPDGLPQVFEIGEVRDHAWIRMDDRPVGTISRSRHENALGVPPGRRLSVLVEEQGRVNYGVRIGEPKGLIGAARLGGQELSHWRVAPIDLATLACAVASADVVPAVDDSSTGPHPGPVALRGRFTLEERTDLVLDTAGWGKGFVFVNGFMLGRYWSNGPQRTMYVPAPMTRVGDNVIVILELEQVTDPRARFATELDFGSRAE